MGKDKLIQKILQIADELQNAISEANLKSKEYSDESRSQLAFEIGYLSGMVKQSVAELRDLNPNKIK